MDKKSNELERGLYGIHQRKKICIKKQSGENFKREKITTKRPYKNDWN